ncbi:MAG: MoaD/ThiS family protein [Gemmatimonadota bacterium]|nr:MAG: MoaD/ThiS family protein [Gemmatimonadota bacterium]
MKVHLEIRLLPMLNKVIGKEELEFDFTGTTVKELIEALIQKYGQKAKEALTTRQGEFDTMIQIALNRKVWITADKHDAPLNDGDIVTFMLLIGGG